ncbi:lysophospholipid acyltransferase family protein [Thermosulfuriphilus sp.]
MAKVRGIFFVIVLVLSVLILGPLTIALGPFDRTGRLPHRIARFWARLLLKVAGVRVEVIGLERLDPNKAYVFAANHASQFDIFALEAGLPFEIRWLAKKELFNIPIFGHGLRAVGNIPVDRESPREGLKSLAKAAEKVKEGLCVVIFPEGTRSPDGRLLPFKPGGMILAIKSKRPLVPLSIVGSHQVLPKGKILPRPGEIKVIIGEPIDTRAYSLKDKERLAEDLRQAIAVGLKN